MKSDEDFEFERIAMENRLKSSGMDCCTYDCTQAHGCPVRKTRRVGLTDEEKQEWIDAMPYDPEPRHCMILVNVIEAKLKEKNT